MNLDDFKSEFEKSITYLKDELASIRTGRASPAMVENVLVEVYGTRTPLKQLASITVPEARTILIQPWDKNIAKDIEKAITLAKIGISPVAESNQLRLTIPTLTEESRKEFVKNIAEKMEKTRIAVRQIRDKIKEEILKQEKSKAITEDDKYDLIKDLDDMTRQYNEKIKELGSNKEKEVMSL